MKGSVGISAPRVSTSFGGSIERGGGGFSSAFSSRGFAEFNKSPIVAPKSPMIDINYGRGETSPFARTPSLIPERKMKISLPAEGNIPKPSIFKDINVPKVEKSPWDTARVITPNLYGDRMSVREIVNRLDTVGPIVHREINRIKNPNSTNPGDPFKDTVVLWQNPNTIKTRKAENPQVQTVGKSEDAPKAKMVENDQASVVYNVLPEKKVEKKDEDTKPQKPDNVKIPRTKPNTVVFAEEFLEVVTVNPETNTQLREAVGADISQALKIVPKIMEARGVSQAEARAEATSILVKKYGLNPDVSVVSKVLTEPQVKPQTKTLLQTQTRTQTLAATQEQTKPQTQTLPKAETNTLVSALTGVKTENKTKLEPVVPKPRGKKVVLHFERDIVANKKRVKSAFNAARRIFETKREEQKVYGKEVAEEVVRDMGKSDVASEIVQGIQRDGTLEDFVSEVSNLGEIKDSKQLRNWAKVISDKFTAVRLTFSKKLGFGAKGENAERVYKQALNGVVAYVAEDGSTGRLYARSGSTSVTYVNYTEGGETAIRPDEQKDQKEQVPQRSVA